MVRLAIAISVFALLACSGSETSQTGEAGEAAKAPAAEAAKAPSAGAAVEEKAATETAQPSATVDPKVQSCLDLVRASKYQQALAVCLAALEIDPDNQQVKDAVATARAETAKLGAAQGAAGSAAESAAGEAASKLGEATGGMAEQPGQ